MFCLNNFSELQWIAIGSIGTFVLAIAAFISLFVQSKQFRKTRADENERAFKNSSVQLITDFDRQFQELADTRSEIAKIIIVNKILESDKIEKYERFDNQLDDIYDFFDTLGFFVIENYIKAEVVHQYFYHWFEHYYDFYMLYDVKTLTGYNETVWINLLKLSKILNQIEVKQLAKSRSEITKEMLLRFFSDERQESN